MRGTEGLCVCTAHLLSPECYNRWNNNVTMDENPGGNDTKRTDSCKIKKHIRSHTHLHTNAHSISLRVSH